MAVSSGVTPTGCRHFWCSAGRSKISQRRKGDEVPIRRWAPKSPGRSRVTLPETNIAPENRVSQKEGSIPTIRFQGLTVSFGEGIIPFDEVIPF